MTARSVPSGELGVVLASLDALSATVLRIEDRLSEQGERVAAACARLESVATRADVSTIVEQHRVNCSKTKDNFTVWAKGIGIILGAIGALIGAFAAAWAITPH